MGYTPKGQRRRQVIADAAAAIFRADGLHAVTHRAVAAHADVPLAATTYYFSSLEELRRAAVHVVHERETARMRDVLAAVSRRRRGPEETATIVVDVIAAPGAADLISWYEHFVGAARDPLLQEGARADNIAAHDHVASTLRRCGWDEVADASALTGTLLSVIDGSVIEALAEGAGASAARSRAIAGTATVLSLAGERHSESTLGTTPGTTPPG